MGADLLSRQGRLEDRSLTQTVRTGQIAHRGTEDSTLGKTLMRQEEIQLGGEVTPNRRRRGGPSWKSEGLKTPMTPVKAGRGREPWFWVLSKEERAGRLV